jgi:hypothetical protein
MVSAQKQVSGFPERQHRDAPEHFESVAVAFMDFGET